MSYFKKCFIQSTLLIILTVTVNCWPSFAYAEGGSSGGGSSTICHTPSINNGKPILLDLALSPATVFDDEFGVDKFEPNDMTKELGADEINIESTQAYQNAITRINLWAEQEGSEKSMKVLAGALSRMKFMIIPYKIKKVLRAFIPEGSECRGTALSSAVLYVNGLTWISIPAWNSLGAKSHEAILIHEALRHLQIFYNFNGDDSNLQEIVRTIMANKLEVPADFDKHPYFNQGFLKDVQETKKNTIESISKLCINLEILQKYQPKKFDSNSQIKVEMKTICDTNYTDATSITIMESVGAFYRLLLNTDVDFLRSAKSKDEVTLIQEATHFARTAYYSAAASEFSKNNGMWDDIILFNTKGFSINLGFSYIREHIKNTILGFDETTRTIHKIRDQIKAACEN